ncbi:Uncharacterized protein APZ42_021195 [Daphnia magna]|uniref:Uncharacterized protein n=1 Tax=Daphnia magna TaxID=35525 RepID=A0A0P6D8Q8_9CRUS|nr:Uncharacterized protein APZ42_021195 [Daphnia magna]
MFSIQCNLNLLSKKVLNSIWILFYDACFPDIIFIILKWLFMTTQRC